MQNIKYHLLNIASVLLFSYVAALTINEIIKNSLIISIPAETASKRNRLPQNIKSAGINMENILVTGFFRVPPDGGADTGAGFQVNSDISELKLLGTVTGPSSIARAMIQKKGEKVPEIFRVWKDVYGYQLIGVETSRVYLKRENQKFKLDLFDKKEMPQTNKAAESSPGSTEKKTISRSEIQQNVMNDLDNAMKGIRAGPHRENGVIEGYKLIRVRPYNLLYKYGVRSGDIVKRINGKKIDSTEKLYNMWQGLKNESRLTVDIDRNGQIITFDVNITD